MTTHAVAENMRSFEYQGRLSESFDTEVLREKIFAHLSFVRSLKKEENTSALPMSEYLKEPNERS